MQCSPAYDDSPFIDGQINLNNMDVTSMANILWAYRCGELIMDIPIEKVGKAKIRLAGLDKSDLTAWAETNNSDPGDNVATYHGKGSGHRLVKLILRTIKKHGGLIEIMKQQVTNHPDQYPWVDVKRNTSYPLFQCPIKQCQFCGTPNILNVQLGSYDEP